MIDSIETNSITRHASNPVHSVVFHPTANPPLLATGCTYNYIKSSYIVTLWLLPPGNRAIALIDFDFIHSIAFHPTADPPLLATGGRAVSLWQLSPNYREMRPTSNYKSYIKIKATLDEISRGHIFGCMAFHPTANPPLLVTGCTDATVKLWQLSPDNTSATCMAILDKSNGGHINSVGCLVFHPTASLFATGDNSGTIKFWDCSQFTDRWQLARASRGFGAMSRILAERLGHDPSVHPTLAFKKNLLKGIVANTTRKSLSRMFGSTDVADRMIQYFSHGARSHGIPGMPGMSRKLTVPQFPLQTKHLPMLENGERSNDSKSPKGGRGSRRRKSTKVKTLKIKNKNKKNNK